jgi:hypothetical protein
VTWWQLGRSQVDHRIPYVHGARLRRYGGKINQVERIIRLLKQKASTRAVAVLVDPFRDFGDGSDREEFASFCLVEFRRRDPSPGRTFIDAIAFYRAQKFARWWPINIGELQLLIREICEANGFKPGRITTIAGDARTISRSPTQVAMPIIDRWLDQAPEKLHLLATVLLNRAIHSLERQQAVRDWERTLADLEASIRTFNSDGVPIAIEGLDTLAAYIEVAAEPNDLEAKVFARRLRDLSKANQLFESSERELKDFGNWSSPAQTMVKELQKMTAERFSLESRRET